MNISERIKLLTINAKKKEVPSIRSLEGELLWYKGWIIHEHDSSNIVRRAAAKAYMHSQATPVIDEAELIVGKPCYRILKSSEKLELDEYKTQYSRMLPELGGQSSHMAVDYELLLHRGIEGVKTHIHMLRNKLNLEDPNQMEKDEFYKACLIALDGVLSCAENYSDHAKVLAERAEDSNRKRELYELSSILRKVPANPADSFHEALQSVHFLTFCLEGLYQTGRPDRYLLEYYQKDIQKGILSHETAQELIDCFCLMFNEYIPRGLAVGFMVGGLDDNGNDVCNDLSDMFIESIGHTRMIYPSVGLCYTPNTPEALLEKSCRLLTEGLSHPALFNDSVITNGLKRYGVPDSETNKYIHSSCVEITPIASSAVWVASPYINLPQLLLDVLGIEPLNDCSQTRVVDTTPEYVHFDALTQEYRRRLHAKVREEVVIQNRLQMNRHLHGGDPLVSCFVNDCLSQGKDIDQGGARYNWIKPSFVGLSNLSDSLVAINQLVYKEKSLSLRSYAEALRNNFEGYELLLQRISHVPKYGNDIEEADDMVKQITTWIIEETQQFQTYRGDRFIPSLFCWVMHEYMGKQTAATPDGRRTAFPLSDGSGPAQGREKLGPTAAILSSTKWSHEPFIGGIAVNMKFSKSLLGPRSASVLASLVKTFMQYGGFEMQVNTVDKETLRKARENPGNYSDLIVRIGGYSDYFVRLSSSMQDELISRSEHRI